MEDKKNGHSDFLRCLWKNTVLPLFPHQGDDNKKEHGWYLLHARCISSHECVPKNSKLLGALGTILHLFLSLFFFPVPNKFVQVRSILTLQIHSAHIPAQSLKRSEKGNGAEEFWVTPAVMRSPLSWQWKKSVNIYRAWSLQWCGPVLLNSSCLQPVSVYTGRVQLWGNAIFLICGEACNAVFILATKGIVCFCNTWLYPTLRII